MFQNFYIFLNYVLTGDELVIYNVYMLLMGKVGLFNEFITFCQR